MSSGSTQWGNPARRPRHRPWLATGWRAAVRLLGLFGLLLAGATLLFVLIAPMLVAGTLIARKLLTSSARAAAAYSARPDGKGGFIVQSQPVGPHLAARLVLGGLVLLAGLAVTALLLPLLLQAIRGLAWLTRRVVADWSGVPAAGRELPPPGAYHAPAGYWRRLSWLLTDPATARDLRWTALNTCLGWIPTLLPAGLMAIGLIGFLAPVAGFAVPPPAFPGNSPPVLVIIGLAFIVTGLGSAPWLLRGYGLAARVLLAPAGQAELTERVQHLAQTRAEAIDTGAAEMRRIERDLHDGAQARLVAMGMTLDAAGQLIDDNPDAARALLLEARDASVRALTELRDLVRGIHPPVLADRGLADAVRALVLDCPLRARLAADLPGRLPAPVESAGYFAVTELLTNVAKHAGASQTWVDIRHVDGTLRMGVSDNGHGGADPARGTGLRGIERRLAAFDGVMAVSSPPGGPTAVTMEVPCALSSPKTSFC
jgi:signal transduction histidine kinase